jgi:hypothetical protein
MDSRLSLARPHIALSRRVRRTPQPDLEAALSAVSPEVRQAYTLMESELSRLGIRHALCGGLAVGALGWPRATKDVDFYVGEEAFEHHGLIVTSRAPFQIGGIAVDSVHFPDAPFLEAELPKAGTGGAIVSAGALVYMKLRAGRMRDLTDVAELVKSGLDVDVVRAYLTEHAPQWIDSFDKVVTRSESEDP